MPPRSPDLPSGAEQSTQLIFLKLQVLDGSGVERRLDVRVAPTCTVGQLKALHFAADLRAGWRARVIFLGRVLQDADTLALIPTGSFLQCYLQRGPSATGSGGMSEAEMLFPVWARLMAGGGPTRTPPCPKWQDFTFHTIFAAGVALAWGAYWTDPGRFDAFANFSLRFFSFAWLLVLVADLLRLHEGGGGASGGGSASRNATASQSRVDPGGRGTGPSSLGASAAAVQQLQQQQRMERPPSVAGLVASAPEAALGEPLLGRPPSVPSSVAGSTSPGRLASSSLGEGEATRVV